MDNLQSTDYLVRSTADARSATHHDKMKATNRERAKEDDPLPPTAFDMRINV
jgi:hypothetical protein